MSLRERLEWLLRTALLVFILAAAAFLSAITAMRFAIHGRTVEMPSLAGMPADKAERLLAARGLGMRVADRVYSNQGANEVVRQSPPAGEQVKVGQRAHVVLSLGPRKVTIPDLVGKSQRAGRIELLRTGLQVGEVSTAYLAGFNPDTVVQQDPAPGSSAASPKVNLLVSAGTREPAYVMPYLVGLGQFDAQRQLAAVGLKLVKITFQPVPEWPHGTVIEQRPPSGARITPGTEVELQVSQ